ncbi:MAG: InlB B-repeat-containing protein, partial [Lachnospiraceae bacterium]|nr:InlB B-repeat-containing protein [Lachnospiraceae bacterium]
YTVSYNGLTGATPSSISDLTGLTYSSASLLPTRNIGGTITGITPSKKGYIFNGWKVTTNGSTTFTGYVGVNNTISDIIGDWTVTNLTLTASFSPYPITVSYTGLDDVTYTPATVSTSGEYDGTLTSPGSDPVKSGYTFKGWKSVDATTPFNWTFDSSSSITTLASSSLLITDNGVKLDNTNHTGTLTLEAQWKMNDYSTITASNFEYGVKTSTYDGTSNTPLTKAVVLKYSNFSAKDSSLNELPDEYISVDSDELDTINKAIEQGNGALNQYPLHINNTLNNTEKVIYVILQDVGDDIKMANTRLSGNNIVLGIDEWKDKELTKDDLMYRISANGVVANSEISRTALTGNDTEFTAIKDAIANNTTGIYPFTINTTNGSIKVNVVIKEKASGVYPSLKSDNSNIEGSIDKGDIGANNIRISKSDEFNADIAKTLCAVEAKDKWANDIALADIGVDADQLSAITSAQNLDATGNYPLRFYIIRTGEEVTINVALYSSTVTDPVTGITLWANNFSYDVDNKTALTKDITKNLSSVIGFNLEGTQLEPEKILVDDESFNALFEKYSNKQVGTYDLTFTSTNEQGTASITIKVTLYQNKPQVVGDGGDTHIDGGGNTGDDHDSGTTDPKTKTKVVYKLISYVKTGDMNNIILLVVLLAMATITGIIIVRKKVKR